MKAITAVLAVIIIAVSNIASAQVEVNANSLTTEYSTLKQAFDAINSGLHTGAIVITIKGIVSESETAELQESGNGNGSDYSSIIIEPENSLFLKIISGNFDAPVIDLNGADNVVFRGHDTLTIQNNSNTDLASVIRFRNGAQNNAVENCLIRGASIGTQSANILFAGSNNASGNNGNMIRNCSFIEATPSKTDVHILSSGSISSPNNSNAITGNRFADFRSSGIHISSAGNGGGWVIRSNSFFQDQNNFNNNAVVTPLRFIPGSTSSGNAIDSNFIGGTQSQCGGPVWQNTGITSFRAITIQCGNTIYTSVTGNVISNLLLSNTGGTTFRGIEVLQGNVVIEGNTIGSESTASSIDLKGNFRNFGIFASTGDTAHIKGNAVANITNITTIPSTSGGLIGIDAGSAGSSPAKAFIRGNRVFMLRTNSSLTNFTGNVRNATGINFSSSIFCNGVIDSNLVHSIYSENTGLTQFSPCGIRSNNLRGNITRNVVYDIRNAGTATSTNPTATGISVSSAGTNGNIVANNMVTLGTGQSSNTTFIGINLQFSSNLLIKVIHNSVRIEGTASVASTHNSFAFVRGTFSSFTSTNPVDIRNNILDNSRTGGTGRHFAVGNTGSAPSSGWNADSIRNNLLNSINPNDMGLWGSTALGITTWRDSSGGDKFSPSGFVQTYVNSAVADLRLNNGTLSTTVESGALFTSLSATDIDGNPRPAPGAINGGGLAPDIGASESDMVPDDVFGPVITISALVNSNSLSNRFLADYAAISDFVSGVNISAQFKPRIYYKKRQDADAFTGNTSSDNGWKFSSVTENSSPFDFVIDYSILTGGGVAAGDTIQYFVSAQDNSGNTNTSAFPSQGFSAVRVDSILSAPSSPLAYIVTQNPLSGIISVGLNIFNSVSGQTVSFDNISHSNEKGTTFRKLLNGVEYNGRISFVIDETDGGILGTTLSAVYPTITDAVNDINARGVNGPLTVLLHDSVYQTEVFPITLNINNEFKTTAVNSILIRPAPGVKTTIKGNVPGNPLLRLIGMSHVTINGSSGSDRLEERDIALMNLAQIDAHIAQIHTADTNSEKSVKLLNLLFLARENLVNRKSVGIMFGHYSGVPMSGKLEDILINNVKIEGPSIGILADGGGQTGAISNFRVENSEMNATGQDALKNAGIIIRYVEDAVVSGNVIGNFETTFPEQDIGIFADNVSGDVRIDGNEISGLDHTGSGEFSGIAIVNNSPQEDAVVVIVNNVIHNIKGKGANNNLSNAKNNPSGILNNANSGNTKIVHNSINMTGNSLSKTGAVSSGIRLVGNAKVDIVNNSVVNNLGVDTTGEGSAGICIVNINQLGECDNNNFFSSPLGPGGSGVGKIGSGSFLDLEQWKAATGKDKKSLSGKPGYTSESNLNPDIFNPDSWNVNNSGAFTNELTDFFGNKRSNSLLDGQPDIGAFEFSPLAEPNGFDVFLGDNGAEITAPNGTLLGDIDVILADNLSGAELPDTFTVKYFQGAVPPDIDPGDKHGFGYFVITADDPLPSGASFTLRYRIDSLATGSIDQPEINAIVSKNDGGFWQAFPAGSGTGESDLNWLDKIITVRGITGFSAFALTDNNEPLPVELTSFTHSVTGGNVMLNWSTSSELNNMGFDIERKSGSDWNKIGFAEGRNSPQGADYSYTDSRLPAGQYRYRLKQTDFNGNFEYFELAGEVVVGVPVKFDLSQNYPNPFNPVTRIDYSIPVISNVRLTVYDMSGREVAVIDEGMKQSGYYNITFNAASLSSGIYIYRLTAGTNSLSKKMTLIK